MVCRKLVPTITLLFVLAAPSPGRAATPAGPRPEQPRGRLGAVLALLTEFRGELRGRIAAAGTAAAAGGPVNTAAPSGGPGSGGGEGQGGLDPSGAGPAPTGDLRANERG